MRCTGGYSRESCRTAQCCCIGRTLTHFQVRVRCGTRMKARHGAQVSATQREGAGRLQGDPQPARPWLVSQHHQGGSNRRNSRPSKLSKATALRAQRSWLTPRTTRCHVSRATRRPPAPCPGNPAPPRTAPPPAVRAAGRTTRPSCGGAAVQQRSTARRRSRPGPPASGSGQRGTSGLGA